ncbi:SDR family NAD(P)-dependent oxidoreductase [Albibacterium indicum]|uniref:SDR family NAD(P)-dependent oxidoreductase n=1 Tax=Albibacterium indicum TaxID=2292082 RepID=UPI000E555990|nr:SDR family NAD(P)-dependent oxidoreductase [Pedobacter indicus]
MTSKKYVLITGGSAGLGKELVIQCASIGLNVIIIALPSGSLRSLARQIGLEFGVDIVIIELNLTDQPLLVEQLEYIKKNYKVNFLINNAGTGGTAELLSSSLNYIDNIVQLNVRAMTTVTSLMVPHLIENEESYIMNISSMAAFSPIAYKTVYPASKAFISSFSLGLREELKHTGVSISVVYPGAIMTNSNVSERIIALGRKGKIGLLPTAEIARIAVKQTLAKKAIIIPGLWNRFNYSLMKLIPIKTRLRIVSSTIAAELKFQVQQ